MMNKDAFWQAMQGLVYLSSCAVNQTVPDAQKIAALDLEQLYEAADRHMMTSLAAMALESAGIHDPLFTQARGKAIRKTAMMEIELQNLLSRLEQERIWYALLKGAVLKDLYPAYGMRQMADIDLLFDADREKDIRHIMEELGFTTELFGAYNHDVYYKQPVCNFELHTELFDATEGKNLHTYYRHIREKLLKDDDNGYGFHFTHEDFYLYVTAHEYKHYSSHGTGLRSLLDIYVYLKAYREQMDLSYIRAEAQKMGIAAFEETNRELAWNLFSGQSLSEEQQTMLQYICFSGTYGNLKNTVQNQVQKTGKKQYVFQRIFLPMEKIKSYYPFFYRHKLLIPFLMIYRVVRVLTADRKKLKKELHILHEQK